MPYQPRNDASSGQGPVTGFTIKSWISNAGFRQSAACRLIRLGGGGWHGGAPPTRHRVSRGISMEGQPLDDRRDPDLKVVLIEAWSVLGRCDAALQHGWQPVLLALADQLRVTSMGMHRWVRDRSNPTADLGVAMSRLARSYGYGAEVMEAAYRMKPPDWRLVDRELRNLYADTVPIEVLLQEETQREA